MSHKKSDIHLHFYFQHGKSTCAIMLSWMEGNTSIRINKKLTVCFEDKEKIANLAAVFIIDN